MKDSHDEPGETADTIESFCEDCGKASYFSSALHGTTQDCQHCAGYVDVGEIFWDENFAESTDEPLDVVESDDEASHLEQEAVSVGEHTKESEDLDTDDKGHLAREGSFLASFRGMPRCPVENSAKLWIENRFSWLTNEFGLERLQTCRTIVPTEEYLPPRFQCTDDCIQDLMSRVAQYMDIDPITIDLETYRDDTPQFDDAVIHRTKGLYVASGDKFKIYLALDALRDPADLVATLAHELGHVILLGHNRISADEPDHEKLTDLITVFMGLGIFPANSVIQDDNWSFGQWSGWSVAKSGYLSMDMFGYAMSLYALARGEPKPSWTTYLRPDVKAAFKRGVRYIQVTHDCEFAPALVESKPDR